MDDFFIKIAEPQTKQEFEAYFLLRYDNLRKPWNQPLGSERDEFENKSIHCIATDNLNKVIGVCRLQFNNSEIAQIRYMAVDTAYREKGIGAKMLYFLEQKAKNKNCKKIILHSRKDAVEFYKKCDYYLIEKSYLLFNKIEHYLMEKELIIKK